MKTSENETFGPSEVEFGTELSSVKVSGPDHPGWFHLRPSAFCILIILLAVFASSCRMDMQDQPKYKAYRSSDFFADGSSMRRPPEGTVARGFLQDDTQLFTGKTPTAGSVGQGGSVVPVAGVTNQPADTTTFPIPVTADVVSRGKERYEIYCSVCHGLTGQGDGMVIRRGFNRKPPSYNEPRLLTAPVGHYFDVITNGWGAMPSYSQQIPVNDRWAIVSYIRALQRSQTGLTSANTPVAADNNSNVNVNANIAAPQPAGNRATNQAGGRR